MKVNGKGLTFGPECVSNKTNVGHFLPGIALCVPSAKRQKVLNIMLVIFKHTLR